MENFDDRIKRRYNRIAPLYDVMEIFMEKGKMGAWRKDFWRQVVKYIPTGGKLLEAGVGTGKNIALYPEGVELYAIDFSEKMLERARKKATIERKEVQFYEMDIQQMDFPDNFFDLIVTTCVFCSVPDPVKGLRELKRVCKETGNIIMLEHMRTEKEPWGKLMDSLNWISLYTWGSNINRRTMVNIKKAGLEVLEVKNLWFDIVKEIVLQPGILI